MSVQFASFSSGGRRWAIALLQIREILRELPVAPMPLSQEHVCGLANLRGQIVTVVDFARAVGLPPLTGTPHLLILRNDAQLDKLRHRGDDLARVGPDLLGLLVNDVGEVLSAEPEDLLAPSSDEATFGVKAVLQRDDELVLVPALDQLIARLGTPTSQDLVATTR